MTRKNDTVRDLFEKELSFSAEEVEDLLSRTRGDRGSLDGNSASSQTEALTTTRDLEQDLMRISRQATTIREGQRVGPYKVLHILDQGGMGEVYLAAREYDGFEKRVALKVLNQSFEKNEELRSLFGRETNIQAGLDHPNIAKFIHAGVTTTGRPYIAMELVEGQKIDRYCSCRDLSLEERIRLFQEVCGAVHHAHQNLIVHSDLKPDNILVTAKGVPKLLDFGIAKFLNPELSSQGMRASAYRLLTPEYASPEQIRGDLVTTATDVYSLGVLLYELLTGQRPYAIRGCSRRELEREICDQPPMAPSMVALRHGEEGSHPSQATPPLAKVGNCRKLGRMLRGDLDSILLKALEKEPSRRYASIEQLSKDLQLYLDHQPVYARDDTVFYRGKKFARRHPWAVAAGVAGLIGGASLLSRAKKKLDVVMRELDEAATAKSSAQVEAEASANEARYIQRLVMEFFMEAPKGGTWEFLAFVEKRLEEDLPEQPTTHANLIESLGLIYQQRGDLAKASSLFEGALAIRRSTTDHATPELVQSLLYLANLRLQQSRYEEARGLDQEAETLRATLSERDQEGYAAVLNERGMLFQKLGDYGTAESFHRQAIEILRQSDKPAMLACALRQLASVSARKSDLGGARNLYQEALAIQKKLGARDPKMAETMLRLAALMTEPEATEAEELARDALEILLAHLPEGDVRVAEALGVLGRARLARGRYLEAEGVLLRSYEILLASQGHEDRLAEAKGRLHELYRAWGKPEGVVKFGPEGER